MADWLVSVALDDKEFLQGFSKLDATAKTAGQRAGESLAESVGKGAKGTTKAVEGAIKGVEGLGTPLGQKLGQGLGKGAEQGLGRLPQIALGVGQQAGGVLQRGLLSGVGTLGQTVARSLQGSQDSVQRAGVQAGQTLIAGVRIGAANTNGVFSQLVQQAQAAAKQVGLTFDQAMLAFRSGSGSVVPPEVIERMRALSPALDQAAGALSRYKLESTGAQGASAELGAQMQGLASSGGLVQTAMTGFAFALSNAVLSSVGNVARAIKGLLVNFIELDTQLRAAAAATGSGENLAPIARVVDQVGIAAAGTTLQVAELATTMSRAGFSVQELEQAMPGIVQAAEATGTQFDTMGGIIADTMRSFGLSADETNRIADVLTRASTSANQTVEDLGQAMQYAAPVARSLNISMEDLTATLSLMANAGIRGTVAGTGLRTGLTRLQRAAAGASAESLGLGRGQEQLAGAMRILGAQVTQANGELKSMDEVLIALRSSLQAMSVPQQVELATVLFGDEAGSKFLAITNQSEEAIRSMFGAIRDSEGAVAEARKTMEGIGLSLRQLGGTALSLGSSFVSVIGAALRPFINAANLVLGAVAALPQPVKQLGSALILLAGGYVTARTAAVLFGAAIKTEALAGVISEVGRLAGIIRGRLVADLAVARGAWTAMVAAMSKGALGPVILQLQQMAIALRSGNAATFATSALAGLSALRTAAAASIPYVIGQLRLLWAAMGTIDAVVLTSAARGMGQLAVSAATTEIALRGVATSGGASTAALVATRGALFSVSQAATAASAGLQKLAATPLGIKVAVILAAAAAITTYAAAQRAAGEAVEGAEGRLQQLNKTLEENGIATVELSRLGGPLQNFFGGLADAAGELVDSLREIPVIGEAAAFSIQKFWDVLKNSPVGLVAQGIGNLATKYREMYQGFQDTSAINRSSKAMQEFDLVAFDVIQQADALGRQLNSIGETQGLEAAQQQLSRMQGSLGATRQALSEQEQAWRKQAEAAKAANNPELEDYFLTLAASTRSSITLLEQSSSRLNDNAQASGVAATAMREVQLSVEGVNAALDELGRKNNLAALEQEEQLLREVADGRKTATEAAEAMYQEAVKAAQQEVQLLSTQIDGLETKDKKTVEGQELIERLAQRRLDLARLQLGSDQEREAMAKRFEIAERGAAGATQERITAERELQTLRNAAPQREAEEQVAYFGQLLAFGQALGNLEQSRFAVAQARLNREIETARAAGASEAQLQAMRRQGESIERAAVAAKLENLVRQQQIEEAVFVLKQRIAEFESRKKVNDARLAELDAELAVNEALQSGDAERVQLAQTRLGITREMGTIAVQEAAAMGDLSRLSFAILKANQETARNQVIAEAASKGMRVNVTQSVEAQQAVAEAAAEFGTQTQDAADSIQGLQNLRIDGVMAGAAQGAVGLESAMRGAVGQAREFYNLMAATAGITPGRWAGGPVEAGGTYRINDGPAGRSLGQESFLSRSGDLQLINRPANAIWRAPSDGIVLPAGLTAKLADSGVFDQPVAGRRAAAAPPIASRAAAAASRGDAVARGLLRRINSQMARLNASIHYLHHRDWEVKVVNGNTSARPKTNVSLSRFL